MDTLFWWTGCFAWSGVTVFVIACAFPDGKAYRGITRLTLYDFGPVFWHVLPENKEVFVRLKRFGYHFLPLGFGWHLGLSLPTWLSRRIYNRGAAK